MGSIYSVNHRPNTWPYWPSGCTLKRQLGGENLVRVEYGTCDDEDGVTRLDMLMRESVLHKCLWLLRQALSGGT